MKILIVDDNRENLYLLRTILKGNGYQVASAENGVAALASLKNDSVDLIISDILMPKMDGFHLCRECKSDKKLRTIPFVFYTAAYTDKKDEEFALSLGAEKYIVKPIEPSSFLNEIGGVIRDSEKGLLENRKIKTDTKEIVYLKEYNERLVRKLENKMQELEEEIYVRQEAENEVREQNKFLNDIMSAITNSFYVIDANDYTITMGNPASGWRSGSEDSKCYQLTHRRDKPCSGKEHTCPLSKVKETKKPMIVEHVHYNGDGNLRNIEVHAYPVFDSRGDVVRLIEYWLDITERKNAEGALRRSEERYRQLVESMNDGLTVIDENGDLTYVNDRLCEMWEYSKEELIARPVTDFLDEENLRVLKSQMELRKKGDRDSYEIEWIKKDGRKIHTIVSPRAVFDGTGNFKGSFAVLTDITDLKAKEEEVRSIAKFPSENPDPVIRISNEGQILYANPEAEELLKESFCGVGDLVPERLKKAVEEVIASKSKKNMELQTKDKLYNLTLVPVSGADYINIYARDITEEKKLEEQFFQSQKMEAVGRLAGGIAHDFNNMMMVVIGFSEFLITRIKKDDLLYPTVKEILKAGKRAAALTQQLLAFSRKQMIQPRIIDLNSTVKNIEKMVRRLIGEDIELKILLDPSLDHIKCDERQIDQIIMNLAVNARDAMPEGGTLTIETSTAEFDDKYAKDHIEVKPGRYVMLAISDTGIGMDAETQNQIFEPFFTTKESDRGTGLGLSTVYGIVKQNGGHISVYSEPGHGTAFKIYLPEIAEVADSEEQDEEIRESLQGSETILLAEDEELVRTFAQKVLTEVGYTVLEACDGEDALQVCKRHEGAIDLMLTDAVMPKLNGREIAERSLRMRPGLKVIFMSGYTDDGVLRKTMLKSGSNFLQKPFTMQALTHKVREVLDTG